MHGWIRGEEVVVGRGSGGGQGGSGSWKSPPPPMVSGLKGQRKTGLKNAEECS